MKAILYGVPKGAAFGPYFFYVHINKNSNKLFDAHLIEKNTVRCS